MSGVGSPSGEMANDFFVDLPKIELHAHLNGSLSEETIKDLLKRNPSGTVMPVIEKGATRTLAECFEMFKIVQKLTCSSEIITYVTKRVIDDFVQDGVCYLELRSTPRAISGDQSSKRDYVNAILLGIRKYQKENPGVIDVRFLLSIDRRLGVNEANDTVELAKEFLISSDGLVLGIDLSGPPSVGDARDYIPVLKDARSAGLMLSLHMAEIDGLDQENLELLQLPPDRIGHGNFLFDNEKCRKLVAEKKIPFEICLTSNVKCEAVESYTAEHHHMHKLIDSGHPYALCTDDKGVFATSLSNEFKIAAEVCEMPNQDMYEQSKNSIEFIFAGEKTKERLREKWETWRRDNQQYFS